MGKRQALTHIPAFFIILSINEHQNDQNNRSVEFNIAWHNINPFFVSVTKIGFFSETCKLILQKVLKKLSFQPQFTA